MKKPYVRGIIFLVLMLVLAGGLSYLSLNHFSKSDDDAKQTNDDMAIALVNEDTGAMYSDSEMDFGDAFVKNVDKNDDHEWYVVSRGVAESGLERGKYEMMLIIPNDFSEKALSIDSETPEQVELNYKINASKDERIQSKAEETASTILNDFNQRIIDVYFASVIGQLNDAQDNVMELVNEESRHTQLYNNEIHTPLSQYTDRFGRIKDHTEQSKERFSGLEDILDSFEKKLVERQEDNEDYVSNIDEAEDIHENASELRTEFMEQLNNYDDHLHSEDVEDQLKELQNTNEFINNQFQTANEQAENDERLKSISSDTNILKERLQESLERVRASEEELKANLEDGGKIDKNIENKLRKNIDEVFGESDAVDNMFATRDEQFRDRMNEQISRLPTLNPKKIQASDLSKKTTKEIKDVIKVTKKYNKEFTPVAPKIQKELLLPDRIHKVKERLHKKGVTVTDTVKLPSGMDQIKGFEVNLGPEKPEEPEKFEQEDLVLYIPGHDSMTMKEFEENKPIKVKSKEPHFKVQMTLKLKEDFVDSNLEELDIYKPVKWNWKLEQGKTEDKTDDGLFVKTVMKPMVASTSSEGVESETNNTNTEKTSEEGSEDESTKSNNEDKDNNDQKEDNNENDGDEENGGDNEDNGKNEGNDGENDEGNGNNKNGDENGEDNENGENGDDDEDDKDDNENDNDEKEEPEKVYIVNNHIKRQVASSVIKDEESPRDLIHSVEVLIKPYEQLQSTYEIYFGSHLDNMDFDKDLTEVNEEDEDIDSLYHLYNEKDIISLLTDNLVADLKKDVAKETKEPLEALQEQINSHKAFIKETDSQAESLIEKITKTRESAQQLNDNLKETMNDIADWRERSVELIDHQTEVQAKNEEEQTVVMSLDDQFQPLMSQSQSLADEASNNLDSADDVYNTFDRVDEQADTIEQSGTELVQQAETLSVEMTDKATEDQAFAENFADVMANSRIGDRENETLYDFLSNPVDTKNKGLISGADDEEKERSAFKPYFLVLISFILALFTAYAISTTTNRGIKGDQFKTEQSLMASNALLTGITASIGALEGITIGILSAIYFGLGGVDLVLWSGMITLVMLAMVLTSTYLLRQLEMIGMFILLVVMSLYLFLSKSIGIGLSGRGALQPYSPLQYIETMFNQAVQGDFTHPIIILVLIGLIVLGTLANLLVPKRQDKTVNKDEEHASQA